MLKNIGKDIRESSCFLVSLLVILVLDQLTKILVILNIPWEKGEPTYSFLGGNQPISVIDGFFYLVHITNDGAAWGMFSGWSYFLGSIAVIVLVGLWLLRKHLSWGSKWIQFCLGIFAGGVLGNLIDRVCYGHVVDFLDVHIPFVDYRWPAFNIADCGISLGVIGYIILTLIEDLYHKKESK